MPAMIVLGDKTDHGGEVIEASGVTDTHGKQIARVGDKVHCPKKGHGATEIVTGVALICAIPAFFFGSSYLMHERGLTISISSYAMLIPWIGLAVYVYWSTVFEKFNGRELLKLFAYVALLCALIFIGLSFSFWAVTSVYGE